ncbi:MAG: hypothetical protein JST30_05870 [Armatimonadetes bacterium]|nr:hypothetical protein [Armatimonadota bacterium]
MTLSHRIRAIAVALSVALSPAVLAVDAMTLTSGDVRWSMSGLQGQRLTGSGGQGSFSVGGTVSPFSQWMWYRTEFDTREFGLSNQTFSDVGTDHAALHYTEDAGGFDDALLVVTEYTVADLGGGSAEATVNFGVFNLLGQAVSFSLFSFADPDLNGTAGDDSAVIGGDFNETQSVFDAVTGTTLTTTASTRRLEGYEIGPGGSILPRLTDSALDSLSDTGSPFGPGDYTGAFQWNASVSNLSVAFVGSVKYHWEVVPEPSLLLGLGIPLLGLLKRRKR